MALTVTSWTAAHTGMPSLLVETSAPGRVVTVDGRVVAEQLTGQRVISDPLAPLGETVHYVVTNTAGDWVETRCDRRDDGHAITALDGHQRVPVVPHFDTETHSTGLELFQPSGARYPIRRYPLAAPSPEGAYEWRTTEPGTSDMAALIAERREMILLHSPCECQIPGCDIRPVRAVAAQQVQARRDGATHVARRVWSMSWHEIAPDRRRAAPVVTWGEYEARYGTWTTGAYVDVLHDLAGMPV